MVVQDWMPRVVQNFMPITNKPGTIEKVSVPETFQGVRWSSQAGKMHGTVDGTLA
jgi:hypothetical protein